ncbi:imidazole glycerol phosphate synthase subunit HisF [Pedobacter hiemivivus]|uniref:imidazole glycerol-phosphate synthase n=1 Tax=Pedobacter hiemivivus TaxID=2530454 RepID=A0A4U1G1D4_9SPHI|nr:imidazole glycerol phosphate synthase cyclase subunit [Pedobacter hiemivivus]TKC56944.1 imidazole glycerol phosphate synthase subunit HisF [Pedobacter hiemivivus]
MLKKRVIPVLSFNGFALVKTKQFGNPRMVGNPMQAARVYNSRNVDELIFVDIFATKQHRKINLSVVKQVINECFMPVTIGGGIDSIKDIHDLLQIGADKVVIKTAAIHSPDFIKEAVKTFGSQCIVIAIDVDTTADKCKIFQNDIYALDFIKSVQDLGAGELFINDVMNDGLMNGFNMDFFKSISSETSLPIIACGGAGKPDHFPDLFLNKNITGVAAASIFHYTQYTPFDIKFAINKRGYPVRLFDQHLNEGVNL